MRPVRADAGRTLVGVFFVFSGFEGLKRGSMPYSISPWSGLHLKSGTASQAAVDKSIDRNRLTDRGV